MTPLSIKLLSSAAVVVVNLYGPASTYGYASSLYSRVPPDAVPYNLRDTFNQVYLSNRGKFNATGDNSAPPGARASLTRASLLGASTSYGTTVQPVVGLDCTDLPIKRHALSHSSRSLDKNRNHHRSVVHKYKRGKHNARRRSSRHTARPLHKRAPARLAPVAPGMSHHKPEIALLRLLPRKCDIVSKRLISNIILRRALNLSPQFSLPERRHVGSRHRSGPQHDHEPAGIPSSGLHMISSARNHTHKPRRTNRLRKGWFHANDLGIGGHRPATGIVSPAGAQLTSSTENPFGHKVTIGVQMRQNGALLGTIPLTMAGDGELFVPTSVFIGLLASQISGIEIKRLLASTDKDGLLPLTAVRDGDLRASYDAHRVEIEVAPRPTNGDVTTFSLSSGGGRAVVDVAKPAGIAAYATLRTSLDYISKGVATGFQSPVVDGQFVVRLGGFVLQDEHLLDPNRIQGKLSRMATSAVYDLPQWDTRITAGDVNTLSDGLQQGSSLLGLSVSRLYRTFEPSRNIRPTSLDSFVISQMSDVEVLVNGMVVRRMSLAPGRYTLNDFPFVTGSNKVQILAVDQSGRHEVANFDRYFDLSLINPGLSEFSFSAGMLSTPTMAGPAYDWSQPYMSGFYRRGISNTLTIGTNFASDKRSQQFGFESIYALPLATIGINAAISRADSHGVGTALRIGAQHINDSAAVGHISSYDIGFETHSANFANPGSTLFVRDSLRYRLTSDASMRLKHGQNLTFGASFTSSRNQPASYDVRANYSFRLGYGASLGVGGSYIAANGGRSGFGALLNLNIRLGRRSSLSSSANSLESSGSVSYNESSTQTLGSHTTHIVGNYQDGLAGLSGDIDFITNRADLSVSHTLDYNTSGTQLTGSRTSVRAGMSIAFADGAVAVGQPIRDSFAIIEPHRTLEGDRVEIDSTSDGPRAKSDLLGKPLVSDITEYSLRTVRVDVPDAPAGYDLGQSQFMLRSPHKAGYKLPVGSEYTVSASGSLRDHLGKPVPLAVGSAISLDDPTAPKKEVFTNSMGRVSIAGLKEGRWEITLQNDLQLHYRLDVPKGAKGLFKFGTLEPDQ